MWWWCLSMNVVVAPHRRRLASNWKTGERKHPDVTRIRSARFGSTGLYFSRSSDEEGGKAEWKISRFLSWLRFGTKWHPERKLSLISAKEQKHDKKRTICRREQNTRVRIVPHPLIGFVSVALIICHTTVSLAGPHIWKHLLTHLQAALSSLLN